MNANRSASSNWAEAAKTQGLTLQAACGVGSTTISVPASRFRITQRPTSKVVGPASEGFMVTTEANAPVGLRSTYLGMTKTPAAPPETASRTQVSPTA